MGTVECSCNEDDESLYTSLNLLLNLNTIIKRPPDALKSSRFHNIRGL